MGHNKMKSDVGLFFEAVRGNNINIVIDLVKQGIDVNSVDKNNYNKTALHIAAEMGYKDILELLIKDRANINIQDDFGDVPLHVAVDNDHRELAKILIENNSDYIEHVREILGVNEDGSIKLDF